jgi:hypothetical protein
MRLLRLFAAIFSSQSLQKIMKTRHLHPSFAFIFTAGCGLLLLTAQAADAQPKPAPKPAPKRAALQPNPQRQAMQQSPEAGASAGAPAPRPHPQKNAAAKQANEGGGRANEAEPRRRWNATTEHRQDAALASLLRKAYVAMSKGDHDYHGHRILAMRQTADAARILGEILDGDGHDREAQGSSDGELREADDFLKRAQSLASSDHRPRVAEHVAAAEREISIALSVR